MSFQMVSKSNTQTISAELLADVLSVSKATLSKWENSGIVTPVLNTTNNKKEYSLSQLLQFEEIREMVDTNWYEESNTQPIRKFSSIELFAGAGGLALGLEQAGFDVIALNEFDKDACNTLRVNRPHWRVIEGDVRDLDFSKFVEQEVDVLAGGFPCQSFSYAGGRLGLDDIRGTLFFEFARAIKEIQPRVFIGENVKGLSTNDDGKTINH
jgi:DNA (cytosine-5)-methyltransferase 1